MPLLDCKPRFWLGYAQESDMYDFEVLGMTHAKFLVPSRSLLVVTKSQASCHRFSLSTSVVHLNTVQCPHSAGACLPVNFQPDVRAVGVNRRRLARSRCSIFLQGANSPSVLAFNDMQSQTLP